VELDWAGRGGTNCVATRSPPWPAAVLGTRPLAPDDAVNERSFRELAHHRELDVNDGGGLSPIASAGSDRPRGSDAL